MGLYTGLKNLTEREKQVLTLRLEGKSLTEISEVMGVTRERIRQLESRLLRKLTKGDI